MAIPLGGTRRAAGLWLLIATLVLVTSGAVAPLAHLRAQQQELAEQSRSGSDARLPAHHAQSCVFCHAAADVPVPAAAAVLLAALHTVAEPGIVFRDVLHRTPARWYFHARAPPAPWFGTGRQV